MAFNENDIMTIEKCLQRTLSPYDDVRKSAEKELELMQSNENYGIILLHIANKNYADPALNVIRISAAVLFKNFVKRHWKEDGDATKISQNDRLLIKASIIDLLLKSDSQIQLLLSEAISVIGKEDFPEKWPVLLTDMVSRMQGNETDFRIINGILQTAHSLFKRYRYEFKSDKLWREIKYVLDTFAKAFTDIFSHTVVIAQHYANDAAALKIIFSSIVLCAKIFYSLNYQDLPEFFEDNMGPWMEKFLALLSYENKLLSSADDEEAGLLEQLKSQICSNISMYTQKYHEEFEQYVPGFMSSVWTLLTNTGMEMKYDLLVSNAIRFLSTVAESSQFTRLFEQDNVIDSLCSKVIIANIHLREYDEEMFTDSPEEYIRRDIEGSDFETRRRAACDLIKALSKFFDARITFVFSSYVNEMLKTFSSNPSSFWKSKDAVMYLVTAISVKTATARDGATSTSNLVDISQFFTNFVQSDLEPSTLAEYPILKADAIKYLVTFRNQLNMQTVILPAFPYLVKHLMSSNIVLHSYAAHAIERIIRVKDASTNTYAIKFEHIAPMAGNMISGLLNIFTIQGSELNEYAMRALMQVCFLMQGNLSPYFDQILPKLTTKLVEVSKNPSKPYFNHYLFETLSLCIKIGCGLNPEVATTFEALLFPVFQDILVQDVQEFMPYVFQLLSLLLESGRSPVPDAYIQLFPCFFAPLLWDRPANIHPLTRLFRAYLSKCAPQIINVEKLNAILGIYQKLIASRANDHEGFAIMRSLIFNVKAEMLSAYMRQMFVLMFHRLTNSKTIKLSRNIIIFFCAFAHHYDPKLLIDVIDDIQESMFGMVANKLFIEDLEKIDGVLERKIVAIGITDILCRSDKLMTVYEALWAPLLRALVRFLRKPPNAVPDEEDYVEPEGIKSDYQVSYSKLFYASQKPSDPFADIPCAKIYLANGLSALSQSCPGRLAPLISATLAPEEATELAAYISAAGVKLF